MANIVNFFVGSILTGGVLLLAVRVLSGCRFNVASRLLWYLIILAMAAPPGLLIPPDWRQSVDFGGGWRSVAGIAPDSGSARGRSFADLVFQDGRSSLFDSTADEALTSSLSASSSSSSSSSSGAIAPEEPRSSVQINATGAIWAVYILVSCGLLGRQLAQGRFWRRCASRLPEMTDARVLGIFHNLCGKFGFAPGAVRLVDGGRLLPVPASGGLRGRKLYFPQSAAAGLSDGELEMLIAHELRHLKRRDSLEVFMLCCAGCFFWFNPFFRVAVRRIGVLREMDCDRSVIKQMELEPSAVRRYLGLLLNFYTEPPPFEPTVTHLSSGAMEIKERMKTILETKVRRHPTLLSLCVVVLAAAGVSLFAVGKNFERKNLFDFVPPEAAHVIYVNPEKIVDSKLAAALQDMLEVDFGKIDQLKPVLALCEKYGSVFGPMVFYFIDTDESREANGLLFSWNGSAADLKNMLNECSMAVRDIAGAFGGAQDVEFNPVIQDYEYEGRAALSITAGDARYFALPVADGVWTAIVGEPFPAASYTGLNSGLAVVKTMVSGDTALMIAGEKVFSAGGDNPVAFINEIGGNRVVFADFEDDGALRLNVCLSGMSNVDERHVALVNSLPGWFAVILAQLETKPDKQFMVKPLTEIADSLKIEFDDPQKPSSMKISLRVSIENLLTLIPEQSKEKLRGQVAGILEIMAAKKPAAVSSDEAA